MLFENIYNSNQYLWVTILSRYFQLYHTQYWTLANWWTCKSETLPYCQRHVLSERLTIIILSAILFNQLFYWKWLLFYISSITKPIFKNGKKNKEKNYRSIITILSPICTIFRKVMLKTSFHFWKRITC